MSTKSKTKPKLVKKYNLGGNLNAVSSLINIPVQAINYGISDLINPEYTMSTMEQDKNPFMSDGGTMPGSKSFDGPSHQEGGIPVDENGQVSNNPIAEVEGDEFMHKFSFIPNKGNYIFSKKLGTADLAESIVDKYTKKKGYRNPTKDSLSKAAMEFELKNVADLNDVRKAFEEQAQQAEQQVDQNTEQNMMRLGGILKKGRLPKYELGNNFPVKDKPYPELFNELDKDPLKTNFNNPLQPLPMRGNNSLGFEIPKSLSDMAAQAALDAQYGTYQPEKGESGKPMNASTSDMLSGAVMIGDAFSALRKAEKEPLIKADYSAVRFNLDSLSADLTPAKNDAIGAFNEGNEQIRDGSTSLQTYMTRRMGSSAQQAEVLSQIAAKEREMKNAIHQGKASMEGQIAGDDANRKYQNRIDNLQNKALKDAYMQRLGDNMLGISKMLGDRRIAEMTIREGNSMLSALSDVVEVSTSTDGATKTVKYNLKGQKDKKIKGR